MDWIVDHFGPEVGKGLLCFAIFFFLFLLVWLVTHPPGRKK